MVRSSSNTSSGVTHFHLSLCPVVLLIGEKTAVTVIIATAAFKLFSGMIFLFRCQQRVYGGFVLVYIGADNWLTDDFSLAVNKVCGRESLQWEE